MNIKEMTNLELATAFTALVELAMERGLITGGYHQSVGALVRHIGRQAMTSAAADMKGGE